MTNYTAKEFAMAAMAALATAKIPTPEKGYIQDGGPAQMAADIHRLRAERDGWRLQGEIHQCAQHIREIENRSVCPLCHATCATTGLTGLVYAFEGCSCETASYKHLREVVYHRECFIRMANAEQRTDT